MRIYNSNLNSTKFNITQEKQYKKFYLETPTDNFTKTQTPPSFKGSVETAAKKVLENEKLTQKFATFMTAAFASLTALAFGNSNESKEPTELKNSNDKNNDTNFTKHTDEIVKNFLTQQISQNDYDEIKNEEIIEAQRIIKNEAESEENKIENDDEPVSVSFPKKRGRLSKEATNLKNIVETIKLKQDDANKLTEICKALLDAKDKANDLYKFDMNFLAEHLQQANQNMESCAQFVNLIYEQYKNSNTQLTNDEIGQNKTTEKTAKNGLTIVGKINLEETNVFLNDNDDPFNLTFDIKFPGTINENNLEQLLTNIVLNFERNFRASLDDAESNIRPRFLKSRPISNYNLEKAIEKDILNNNYKNITTENIAMLKNIICSEPRFKKYFNLHASLRFIDRAVNFNDDTDIEVQTKEKLDLFFKGLSKAMSQGVIVKTHDAVQKNGAMYWAPRVIIEPNKAQNPELYEFAGSTPLAIGLSEKYDCNNSNLERRTSIINTIFFKGI